MRNAILPGGRVESDRGGHQPVGLVDHHQAWLVTNANVAGWVPRTNKRWAQFCNNPAVGLTTEGFGVNEQESCCSTRDDGARASAASAS